LSCGEGGWDSCTARKRLRRRAARTSELSVSLRIGGTPTYRKPSIIARGTQQTARRFQLGGFCPSIAIPIELLTRYATAHHLDLLGPDRDASMKARVLGVTPRGVSLKARPAFAPAFLHETSSLTPSTRCSWPPSDAAPGGGFQWASSIYIGATRHAKLSAKVLTPRLALDRIDHRRKLSESQVRALVRNPHLIAR
jgi:hypothetical protein